MLTRLVFFFLIVISTAKANNLDICSWDNKNNIPCLKINSDISNTSKLNIDGIKKTTITRKQIEKSGAIDIIDVLKTVPSINITQSGPKGQQASLFMRGSGSNHALVLINGVAVNDQSTTQGLFDFGVDFIQTIQQIEIYEGPGTTIFGPNAIGGAINIITTGDYKDHASFSSMDIKNVNFLINKNYITQKSTAFNFKIGGVKSETISAKYGGKENDELNNLTGNFNLEKWTNNNFQIINSVYLRQTIAEYDDTSTNELGYEGDNKMLSTQLKIKHQNKSSKNEFTFFLNKYDREYDEKGIIDYYDSNAVGVKYDLSKLFLNNISYGMGSEYRHDNGEFENNGAYSSSTKGHYDNFSVYGNFGLNLFNNSNLSLFLRNDENDTVGSNQSRKINLEHKYNDLNFGIGRMEGFRSPTIYELYGTDNYGYSGNKNLKPEKSISNEVYLKFDFFKKFNGSIRGFKSRIYDQIEYSNNKYINSDNNLDLKQSGINTEVKFDQQGYNINLFSSLLSSKKTNGQNQLRRPEKTYGFNLNKKINLNDLGDFSINLKYNHYGKHLDTHATSYSTIEMDSTDIIDLSLNKKFGLYNFYINFTNLLDESYQRPHGYSQNGRLFYIGFKLNK